MSVRLPLHIARPAALCGAYAAAALVSAVLSPAAVAAPPCHDEACASGEHCGHPVGCDCRSRYACDLKVDSEPIEKECALVETEVICIPPICSSPFDGLCDLLSGKRRARGGCGADGCTVADCDGSNCAAAGCGSHAALPRRAGWFSRLTKGGCGGIRCVNVLDSREYECGRRCTYEWSAVPVDDCGRRLTECGEPAAAARVSAPGPQEEPPPPAPAPPAQAPPALEIESSPSDNALAAPTQQGAAQQAIER